MPDPVPLWRLTGFEQQMDDWVTREQPSRELQAVVAEWIPTRRLNPTWGARKEPQVPGLWWLRVPDTSDGHAVVICTFFAENGEVKCVGIYSAPGDV